MDPAAKTPMDRRECISLMATPSAALVAGVGALAAGPESKTADSGRSAV
jgi:hypothetical protein